MRSVATFLLFLSVLGIFPESTVCLPNFLSRAPALRSESSFRSWLRRRQDDNNTTAGDAGTYRRIEVTGAHAWKAPGPNDKRGPCPALNSLANHGYLPRNGVVGLLSAATVTNEIFGIGIDLSLPLSLYATLLSGNILTLSWSIGGPTGGTLLGLLGTGKGLSGSHNKYETDASVTHGDSYLFNGDVNSVQLPKFKKLLSLQANAAVPNWTLDVMNIHRNYTLQDSISTNPYFFFGPVSGLLVSNAGHCFVPGMMGNHSAQWPNGRVTKEILQSFFAVHEDTSTGTLTHTRGHERIPHNWHRRAAGGVVSEYGNARFAVDLVRMAAYNPAILKVGGNMGTVNSFAGVDLGGITGGIYNSFDLLDPDMLVCFIFRTLLAVVPDLLQGGLLGALLNVALKLLTTTLLPLFNPKCPGIQNWNGEMLEKFPGAGSKAV